MGETIRMIGKVTDVWPTNDSDSFQADQECRMRRRDQDSSCDCWTADTQLRKLNLLRTHCNRAAPNTYLHIFSIVRSL